MSAPTIAILMGSKSDWDVMRHARDVLAEFGVSCEARVLSAHRTPAEAVAFVEACDKGGTAAFICAAGMAAHLAGVVAAHTLKPVLGVPMAAGSLQGVDALLSTVQMPGGIPVATFGIGKAGAQNAALFAVAQLAIHDSALAARLQARRDDNKRAILAEKLT